METVNEAAPAAEQQERMTPTAVVCSICRRRPTTSFIMICEMRIAAPLCGPCKKALGPNYKTRLEKHVVCALSHEPAFATVKEVRELKRRDREVADGPSKKA